MGLRSAEGCKTAMIEAGSMRLGSKSSNPAEYAWDETITLLTNFTAQ